jgi:hypothetical protein
MSVPESRNFPPEEGITEVEFSAEDVQSLPRPRDSAPSVPREAHAPAATAPVARRPKAVSARASGARAWQLPAVVAAASLTALVGVGCLYAFAGKHAPAPPPAASLDLVEPEPIVPSVKQLAAAGPIVRIKNPFDRHEVFEFPPGTSKAEAREAVAKLLMERAMERRALLSANTPKRFSANTPRRRKTG